MLKQLKLSGFKSFARPSTFEFTARITAIVGPNGSGKSNVAEAFRFGLGEQSIKSMRGKRGEDLIWSGSKTTPRANRASVSVTFDNTARFLDVDFDEVAVERVVHRDGINDYLINGTQVRLKDVSEMLAGANIGETGHHIISQGEADRILSANPRERRTMIEDALGLKVFQYKKEESERKLEKTKENIAQVAALRREVAPHLAFLKRQMEKINKTQALREEFAEGTREYLKRESLYLDGERARLSREKREPEAALAGVRSELTRARAALEKKDRGEGDAHELATLGRELEGARAQKANATREIGRIEGQIAFSEEQERTSHGTPVARKDVEQFVAELERHARDAEHAETSVLRALIRSLLEKARTLLSLGTPSSQTTTVVGLREKLATLNEQLAAYTKEEARLVEAHESIRARVEAAKDASHDLERSVFSLMSKEQELSRVLYEIESQEGRIKLLDEEFKRDAAEAAALIGAQALAFESVTLTDTDESRETQEKRKRVLEKMKIRLEEFGGGSDEEVRKEFAEVSEREAFLERETADLEASAEKLAALIVDLNLQLETRFAQGLAAINAEFGRLFAIMFDGGSAALTRTKEKKVRRGSIELDAEDADDDEIEGGEVVEGVEVQVSLPRKRIKGLVMLSGGERALTSIGLIFAMASVNPPPFLVLDETDAALDEANSRRYGDMLETLAGKSQLIVITHNRETMSRAGVLYGVTMGADGVSKLLSVKFEEAVAVAK